MSESTTITRDAFGKAYEKHFARTVRVLTARRIPYDIAQDAAQSAWASAWEHREQLRTPAFLGSWVGRIVLNAYGTIRRREHWAIRGEFPLHIEAPSKSLDTPMLARQLLAWAHPHERRLLEMKYFRDMTIMEMSTELGMQESMVKTKLDRARGRLDIVFKRICQQSQ